MGNKICKKKADNPDSSKSPSTFDRIFTRLHIKQGSWKSDSHLNGKQVNRYEVNPKERTNGSNIPQQILVKSKSSDWTEADLEVPEKDGAIHLQNPQLTFIFNDNTTPTPPPRKHKKSIREKIESVARNSFQALQSKKSTDDTKILDYDSKIPVDEPPCIKKVINYKCPCDDLDHCAHKEQKQTKQDVSKNNQKYPEKDSKRAKNLSVVSLPNYNELKFSIANSEDSNLKYIDASVTNSSNSLPGEVKKSTSSTPGKLENYMTRCRSFGSLLNNKLKTTKEPADVESDDSFGGLEDWDLGILEHYNPKDASLPRPRKLKHDDEIISDIEKLIIPDDDIEEFESAPPRRPLRRAESLLKKKNKEVGEDDDEYTTQTLNDLEKDFTSSIPKTYSPVENEITKEDHSILMKILQDNTTNDIKNQNENVSMNAKQNSGYVAPIFTKSPSFYEVVTNITTDFINTEKQCVS